MRTIAGVAGVAFGLLILQRLLSGFLTGIVVLALISLTLLILFFLDRRFPPSFSIDVRGRVTDYEFRNAGYAERFAAINGASSAAA